MNRRDFFKMSGVGGLATLNLGVIAQTLAQSPPSSFTPATVEGRDPVTHIINRLTLGVTPELYQYVRRIGVEAFIEEQLNPESMDDTDCDSRLEMFPLIYQPATDLLDDENGRRTATYQLMGATVVRAVYSRRQLYERMVNFWSDHFHIYIRNGNITSILKLDDDRAAIRANALTTFRQILGASAHSPAMLFYLDNFQSRAEHPNENYARELMELHTLGVNGGYTEDDVQAVARAFTGWSMGNRRDGEGQGEFVFRQRVHDDGEKVILGESLPAGRGIEDGEAVLDILASHPSAARFISTKLVRRFVADLPPESLVTRCAETFLQTGGDIKAVLRVIFASEEFWNAPPRFKRPLEYTYSLMRGLAYQTGFGREMWQGLAAGLEAMGQVPFSWPAPNGYPDVGAYWMSNLLPRWNMAINLVEGGAAGSPNYAAINALIEANGVTTDDTLASLNFLGRYLYGRDLTEVETQIIAEFMTAYPGDLLAGASLLIAAPAFQYF